jgi:hypothetical protein
MKTYIEEFLMTFSGFHQTVFSFLTAYSLQQLFPQLTAHSNFFHSHSPTKQTLRQQQKEEMNPPNPPLARTDLVVAAQMRMMRQMADTMAEMHAQMRQERQELR